MANNAPANKDVLSGKTLVFAVSLNMDLITLGDISRAMMALGLGGVLLSVFYIIYHGLESALIVAAYTMAGLAVLVLVVCFVSSGFGLNSTLIR